MANGEGCERRQMTAERRALIGIARTARRLAVALAISVGVALVLSILWKDPKSSLYFRAIVLGVSATVAFSIFEAWPRRLPRRMERWVLQVTAVGVAMPMVVFVMHRQASSPGAPPFFEDHNWMLVGFSAILVAPWAAVATVVRQKEAFARNQTLTFALERSELERQALDARLHLLRAQVAPHFLFNTLANVQALVDAGSPHASAVLRSLTAYLRAAVPMLHESAATIERELQLVRPYLELMQMRMPDRLEYVIDVDPSTLTLRCPPTTLLTLVENAVRHGIDPSEQGGRIDVDVARVGERCVIRVSDTGAGLHQSTEGLGSGLTTVRERLRLIFGNAADLRLTANDPRGAVAEIDMPAQAGTPDTRSLRVGVEP
jgi:signal transduction histidine kinase